MALATVSCTRFIPWQEGLSSYSPSSDGQATHVCVSMWKWYWDPMAKLPLTFVVCLGAAAIGKKLKCFSLFRNG